MTKSCVSKTPGSVAPVHQPARSRNAGARTTYLGPLGVDQTCLDGVIQGGAVLAQPEIGGGAVAVQDAVLGVGGQGFGVEAHGQGVLPLLAGLVTAPHALQEFGLAEAAGAGRPVDPPEGVGRRRHGDGGGGREGGAGGGPVVGAGTKKRELRREGAIVTQLVTKRILNLAYTLFWVGC